MNCRDAHEDGPPSERMHAISRPEVKSALLVSSLRFEGGELQLTGMKASHPDGVTPTTIMTPEQKAATYRGLMLDDLRDAIAFLQDAAELIEKLRVDEAKFELRQAERHVGNVKLWMGE